MTSLLSWLDYELQSATCGQWDAIKIYMHSVPCSSPILSPSMCFHMEQSNLCAKSVNYKWLRMTVACLRAYLWNIYSQALIYLPGAGTAAFVYDFFMPAQQMVMQRAHISHTACLAGTATHTVIANGAEVWLKVIQRHTNEHIILRSITGVNVLHVFISFHFAMFDFVLAALLEMYGPALSTVAKPTFSVLTVVSCAVFTALHFSCNC